MSFSIAIAPSTPGNNVQVGKIGINDQSAFINPYFVNLNVMSVAFTIVANGLRYKHVAGFGALLCQNTPKLDARLKA